MRTFLFIVALFLLLLNPNQLKAARLPNDVVFVSKWKFNELVRKGTAEGWARLPLGERTGQVGIALVGVPYKNYTLELDDRIETLKRSVQQLDHLKLKAPSKKSISAILKYAAEAMKKD